MKFYNYNPLKLLRGFFLFIIFYYICLMEGQDNKTTGGNTNFSQRTCLNCEKKDGAIDTCEICKPKGMLGWICPVCGRGNSPFNSFCPCKAFSSYPTFGGTSNLKQD